MAIPNLPEVAISDNTDNPTSIASDSTPPFRFMDLPPEIRNRVYSFYMEEELNRPVVDHAEEQDDDEDEKCREADELEGDKQAIHDVGGEDSGETTGNDDSGDGEAAENKSADKDEDEGEDDDKDRPSHMYKLEFVKTPAISRVSKQLRTESLPIFFAEPSFYANISCNFFDKMFSDNGHKASGLLDFTPRLEAAGVLKVDDRVEALLNKMGNKALFRDVCFNVYDEYWVRDDDPVEWGGRDHRGSLRLFLRWKKDGAKTYFEKGPLFGWGSAVEDLVSAAVRFGSKASSIAARDGFKGFTLEELKRIAECLRFEVC